jgi:hypothetical protein
MAKPYYVGTNYSESTVPDSSGPRLGQIALEYASKVEFYTTKLAMRPGT